jgi:TRPM family ion channel/conflict system pore-forming effector with SLATT domain
MDLVPNIPTLSKGEIRFPNDNRAVFVKASPDHDPSDLITALEIKKPAMVLLLIGGADELHSGLNSRLLRLLDEGLGSIAVITDALIIDGGTEAGVMALMGKVVARRGHSTRLLGIAPAGKVTYPGGPEEGSIPGGARLDPNHSHFVLVEGSEWSSGTETMFKLVGELAKESRVVVVLVNGGEETRDEVARCVEHGWPIIVIEGSGRLADEIAAQARVTGQGEFDIISLNGRPASLRESIVRHSERVSVLIEAWTRFAQYDSRAHSMQSTHAKFLSGAFALGVLGTLFAVTQRQLMTGVRPPYDWIFTVSVILLVPVIIVIGLERWFNIFWTWLVKWIFGTIALSILIWLAIRLGKDAFLGGVIKMLGYLLLVVPFVTSVLATASERFKPSKKWILMRRGAEEVKKEIFRYRSQVSEYSGGSTSLSPDQVLAKKLAAISRRLMRTEASSVSLTYRGQIPPEYCIAETDDGFAFLSPERYLDVRLGDQLDYYNAKTAKLERRTMFFQWSILIIGALGTLLAALGDKLWVAVTSALVTGLTVYIAQIQLDPTLIKFNQSAAELRDLRTWWLALPKDAKSANKNKLVEESEKILEGELTGWSQAMEGSKKEDDDENQHE